MPPSNRPGAGALPGAGRVSRRVGLQTRRPGCRENGEPAATTAAPSPGPPGDVEPSEGSAVTNQQQPASPAPGDPAPVTGGPAHVSGSLARPRTQRRAHYRVDDDQPVLVQLLDAAGNPVPDPAESFVARLADLSESGLRLVIGADTSLLLPVGASADLVVSLPETNERLRGTVVHQDRVFADGTVVLGLTFTEHERGGADRIRRHVFAVQRERLARRKVEPAG